MSCLSIPEKRKHIFACCQNYDAGDKGQSASYGGNFYEDWEDSHSLGSD